MVLPDGFHSRRVEGSGVQLHVVTNAVDGDRRQPFVFLHGFPEFWIAWEKVFTALADDFLVIAPDQRGFNLSDAPQDVDAYATRNLVADLFAIVDAIAGIRPVLLAGHDWGASVAYAAAIALPARVSKLVIANGVHPVCFQKALIEDPKQAAASQYMHLLRASGSAAKMSADGFRRTLSMFEKFSATPWLSEEIRERYREAWGQPRRLNAMLNWYRATPLVIPRPGEATPDAPLARGTPERFGISMPHLLIWGGADQALQPVCHAGLEQFAPLLESMEIAEADHWLLHVHHERIATAIRKFVAS